MTFAAATQARAREPAGLRISANKIVGFFFFIFVVCGAFDKIQPSPYDFASLVAMPVWFVFGFRARRMFVPYFFLMTVYLLSGFITLIPYWNEPDPVMFELQSFYLYVTGLFFALFFAERTLDRGALLLKAYTASCLVGAVAAIAGFFDIGGSQESFATWGRASGTFKDANVFGSYIILGALYLTQTLMLRQTRRVGLVATLLLIILAGLFLSFSRGSWGAFVFAASMMIGMALMTTPDRKARNNIVVGVILAGVVLAILVAALMSIDSVRELAAQRLQPVGEEYDDPRFFNQMRSLPMLLERPLGFGPLRFRLWFDLEPHSSFVNGFASYGWVGGVAFILLVGATAFVGFRLCFARSPYQTMAQVVWPSLLVFFLQGFQIDIDHWRHVYLMMGAIWGFEAARYHWLLEQRRAAERLPRRNAIVAQ